MEKGESVGRGNELALRVARLCQKLFHREGDPAPEGLEEAVSSFLEFREKNPSLHLRSTGFSSGAHKLEEYVIKEAQDEEEALSAVALNDLVGEHYPEMIMPMEAVGRFLVSRRFDETRLDEPKHLPRVETPYGIIEKHLRNSINLNRINPFQVVPRGGYGPEEYGEKFRQNLEEMSRGKAVSRTLWEAVKSELPEYYERATHPFWDCNLQNAKYSRDGVIKNFDWKKATKRLVIPVYESVQIAYRFGKRIEELKESARQEYELLEGEGTDIGFELQDFDRLWGMGALYFLTRRIYYGYKHDNTGNVKKYQGLLGNQDFEIPAGLRLAEELR